MGLDPVQNLSKSGLKPDYDDQRRLRSAESVKVTNATKSYKLMHAAKIGSEPKINQNPTKSKSKSSQIQPKSSQSQIQIKAKSKIESRSSPNPNQNLIQIKIQSKS